MSAMSAAKMERVTGKGQVLAGLALAITAVSFASIFIKRLELRAVPALTIAFYRMILTVALLAPILFVQYRQELRRLTREDVGLIFLGGLCLAVHFGAWTLSLRYISIPRSVIIVDSQPIFTVLASVFFLGERPTRWDLIGVLLAIGGIVTITGLQSAGEPSGEISPGGAAISVGQARLGDLLALCGAIAVVGYILVGRKLRPKLALTAYVVPLYTVCAGFLLIGALIGREPLTTFSGVDFLYFLALAIVPTILGHTVFNWALRHAGATLISVSFLGEPIGATILAFFFYRQIPGRYTFIGGLMVLGGIYMTGFGRAKPNPADEFD